MLLKRILPLTAAALALWACGTLAGSPVDRPQADARQAISGLLEDYQAPRPESFFERFDQSRFPNFETFRYNVREFLLLNHQVSLDIVVDTTTSDPSGVSVQTHWNRSSVGAGGAPVLKEGRCALIFRRQPSGGLLLASIAGDSPF